MNNKEVIMASFSRLVLLLFVGLLFISCPQSEDPQYKYLDIDVHPENSVWNVESAVTFTLTAAAVGPHPDTLSYQWYFNTVPSIHGVGRMEGKTGKTLTLTREDYGTNRNHYFYAVVTDTTDGSRRTSRAAAITVTNSTTTTYFPGEPEFIERMTFFTAVWDSGTDGYRVRKWGDFTSADKSRTQVCIPSVDLENPTTYSAKEPVQDDDYALFYDDMGWMSTAYIGVVRAINIFNDDLADVAIIIEYFTGGEPYYLYGTEGITEGILSQGLDPGEKPFFGVYCEIPNPNVVYFGNATELSNLGSNEYHTDTVTLTESINKNTFDNKDKFIAHVAIPWYRTP